MLRVCKAKLARGTDPSPAGGLSGFRATGDLTSASIEGFAQAVELFAQPDVGIKLQAESKKFAQLVSEKKISAFRQCSWSTWQTELETPNSIMLLQSSPQELSDHS